MNRLPLQRPHPRRQQLHRRSPLHQSQLPVLLAVLRPVLLAVLRPVLLAVLRPVLLAAHRPVLLAVLRSS
jgi:hypothetical protein